MLQRQRAAGNTWRTSRGALARSESRRRNVQARSSCRHRARRSDIRHEPRRLEQRRGSPAGFEVHRRDAEMALAEIARWQPAVRKKRSRARPAEMRLLSSAAILPSCRVDCDPTASPQSRLCRHRRCLAASVPAGAPAGLGTFPSAEPCVRRSSGNRQSPSTSRA